MIFQYDYYWPCASLCQRSLIMDAPVCSTFLRFDAVISEPYHEDSTEIAAVQSNDIVHKASKSFACCTPQSPNRISIIPSLFASVFPCRG